MTDLDNCVFTVIWSDDYIKVYPGGKVVAYYSNGSVYLQEKENEERFTSGILFLNKDKGSLINRMTTYSDGKAVNTTVMDTNHLLKSLIEGLDKASRSQTTGLTKG